MFNHGAGAASGEEMAQLHRTIDPQGQMRPDQLATHSITALWDHFTQAGQPVKAAAGVASVMQHQKAVSAHFSQQAANAIAGGNLSSGVALLTKAYEQIPDAGHFSAVANPDGTADYRVVGPDGKVVSQGRVDGTQLMQIAHMGASGAPYVKATMRIAANAQSPAGGPGSSVTQRAYDTAPAVGAAQTSLRPPRSRYSCAQRPPPPRLAGLLARPRRAAPARAPGGRE